MTIAEVLGQAVAGAGRGEIVMPGGLAGFPGTAHGGAVAALFWRLALPRPPALVHLRLLRGVPVDTPLHLRTEAAGHEARLTLAQGERTLAEATISREALPRVDAADLHAAWMADRGGGQALPGTATCLACGTANPLGLAVRFLRNDRFLWREYRPRPAYRHPEGGSHPALATVMLDELGWWLGALATGECGVTTDVRIALLRPLPDGPVLALGDRRAVTPDGDARERYQQTESHLLDAGGAPLAAAWIRFAGSRAYTRRLLEPFLATTDLATLARIFPSTVELAGRRGGDGAALRDPPA